MKMLWEHPPERHRGPGVAKRKSYSDRQWWIDQLKERPGAWAKWPDAVARASQLGLELRRSYPGLDVVVRENQLWARWPHGLV